MKLSYTHQAIGELEAILDYVEDEFGLNARLALATLLAEFEARVITIPGLYPPAPAITSARMAVLHHRLILIYEVWDEEIVVVDAWDTRRDK